jgi:hypothetical protein
MDDGIVRLLNADVNKINMYTKPIAKEFNFF